MLISEIANAHLREMALDLQDARSFILGIQRPINDHLIKILAFDAPPNVAHWQKETVNWLDEIAEILLKPNELRLKLNNKKLSAQFVYELLYDGQFGGKQGEDNIARRIARMLRDGYVAAPGMDTTDVLQRLQRFHQLFAEKCATGKLTIGNIETMVRKYCSGVARE